MKKYINRIAGLYSGIVRIEVLNCTSSYFSRSLFWLYSLSMLNICYQILKAFSSGKPMVVAICL